MKNTTIRILLICILVCIGAHLPVCLFAQNVGIGIVTPAGKLHIKGSADTTQLIIEANGIQSNTNPLIKLRRSDGTDLMWIHSDDVSNSFFGLNAGRVNIVGPQGVNNTFIGSGAGYSNTNGRDNTALGTNAFFSSTKASQNTAIGVSALYTQSFSPPAGAFWQSFNVAVGYEALYSNQPTSGTNGVNNTALGTFALRSNTTGTQNTASGMYSLYQNTTGNYNTAVGNFALNANSAASENTAIGNSALFSQSFSNAGSTWISSNVAVGFKALFSNQPVSTVTGISNTAVGHTALYSNTTGYENAATGINALSSNTTRNWNAAFGAEALINLDHGENNTALGGGSGTAAGQPVLANTISLGNRGNLNPFTNNVYIGNFGHTWIGGNVPWSTYSDARVKNNITEDVKGLDFITRLRPVTYYRSIKAMTDITGNQEIGDYSGKYDIEKIKFSGFLAQEVEEAAKKSNYDFSGITVPKNSKELYTLSYEQFVVPLVKAVKEQQTMIEQQNNMITEQAGIIQDLLKRITALEYKTK